MCCDRPDLPIDTRSQRGGGQVPRRSHWPAPLPPLGRSGDGSPASGQASRVSSSASSRTWARLLSARLGRPRLGRIVRRRTTMWEIPSASRRDSSLLTLCSTEPNSRNGVESTTSRVTPRRAAARSLASSAPAPRWVACTRIERSNVHTTSPTWFRPFVSTETIPEPGVVRDDRLPSTRVSA